MSGSSPQVGGPAPTDPQPQAGTPGSAPQAGSGQQPPKVYQFKTHEEAEAFAERMLEEKRQANAEAKRAQDELKKLQDAAKTDEQKRAERLAELEAQTSTIEQERQQWRVERAVMLAAPAAGLSAALAIRLIDLAEVKYKDGEPTNIAELLTKALAQYPELKPAQQPGQPTTPAPRQGLGASNPPRSSTNNQPITHAYIRELMSTPEGRATYEQSPDLRNWVRTHPERAW